MGVSRSGYYDWKKRSKEPPHDRQLILDLVAETHKEHPSHGYCWVHAWLEQHNQISVSADYIRKCFDFLGIRSKTKHQAKQNNRKNHSRIHYPNLIFDTWDTVDRPRQVIVSDMTAFWTNNFYFELTLYFDVYTKQILGWCITKQIGWPGQYFEGLKQTLEEVEESMEDELEDTGENITILHTDCGSVYTSIAYNALVKEKNLVRSCSRVGTPTDNPVNESLNGWIKEELYLDFNLYDVDNVVELIERYVIYFNSERPCYSLGYDTPNNFYAKFKAGEIECKDTFKDRVLDPTPKYVKKLKEAHKKQGSENSETA